MSENVFKRKKVEESTTKKDKRLKEEPTVDDLDNEDLLSDDDDDDDEGLDAEMAEDEEAQEEEAYEKEIEVTFDAYPPIEEDHDGIVRLLRQLFLKESLDVGSLADVIISQKELTTILKQVEPEEDGDDTNMSAKSSSEDDDDVYGVVSLLDLAKPESLNQKGVQDVRDFLVRCCKSAKNDQILKVLEGSKRKALILNERFVNLPPKLCVPCYDELQKEMERQKLEFDYFFTICKVLHPKKSKKKGVKEEELIFLNPEDELLQEACDGHLVVDFSHHCDGDARSGSWDDDDKDYSPKRHILLFEKKSWLNIVNKLRVSLQ